MLSAYYRCNLLPMLSVVVQIAAIFLFWLVTLIKPTAPRVTAFAFLLFPVIILSTLATFVSSIVMVAYTASKTAICAGGPNSCGMERRNAIVQLTAQYGVPSRLLVILMCSWPDLSCPDISLPISKSRG